MPTLQEWLRGTTDTGVVLDPAKVEAYRRKVTPQPPPLVIRGWNFAAALAKWTLAGMPRRTQAEIDERLAICQACPNLQDGHCARCGCACIEQNHLVNKLSLATETCPDGKWT